MSWGIYNTFSVKSFTPHALVQKKFTMIENPKILLALCDKAF